MAIPNQTDVNQLVGTRSPSQDVTTFTLLVKLPLLNREWLSTIVQEESSSSHFEGKMPSREATR